MLTNSTAFSNSPSALQQSAIPQIFVSQNPPEPQYYFFRGHKKKLSEVNKMKMLKTKRIKDKQQKGLRYDDGDQEFYIDTNNPDKNNQETQPKREEISSRAHSQRRVKSQFQIMKLNPIDRLQRLSRNKSTTENNQLMIRTSRMQIAQTERYSANFAKNLPSTSLQPSSEQGYMTKFYSKNLQERMNEYLNMVVAKSSHDHNEKVKKMKEEQEQKDNASSKVNKEKDVKMFVRNKFLRELKTRTNLIKKNQPVSSQSHYSNANDNSIEGTYFNTSRQYQQTARASNLSTSRHREQQYSHSRMSSIHNNQNVHNHSNNNGKMAEGEELINFASQVLSKSMKVYGTSRGKVKENSVKKLNYSMQVGNK